MYAIVDIQGQQFKVEKEQKVFVHRLEDKEGSKVSFDQVLLVDNDGKIDVGAPTVKGASVNAKIVSHIKGDKVKVFKKKRRKGYQKLSGHRQSFTELLIEDIALGGSTKKAETKAAEPKAETQTATAKKETTTEEKETKTKAAPKSSASTSKTKSTTTKSKTEGTKETKSSTSATKAKSADKKDEDKKTSSQSKSTTKSQTKSTAASKKKADETKSTEKKEDNKSSESENE